MKFIQLIMISSGLAVGSFSYQYLGSSQEWALTAFTNSYYMFWGVLSSYIILKIPNN